MPKYEIKTTYREVVYGNCWLTVEAVSEEDAIAKVEHSDYEWEHSKTTAIEDLEIGTSDVYWIKEVSKT